MRIVKRPNGLCLVNIQWGVNINSSLCGWINMWLFIMDQRVFGQMRRHHTLTLILLIHLSPLCLWAKVCVIIEVRYHCKRVLCWKYFPLAQISCSFHKMWEGQTGDRGGRKLKRGITQNIKEMGGTKSRDDKYMIVSQAQSLEGGW